jgi:hypothetical protein
MINVQSAYIRAYLKAVERRASEAAIILDWANGTQTFNVTDLLPAPQGEAGWQAWQRFEKQMQTLGPRALRLKRDGAIGEVTWGGRDPKEIDEKLTALDLRGLARSSFTPLFANGITAAWAYADERTGRNRVQRLGGYLEPLYHPDDSAGEPVALYQVTDSPSDPSKYRVRVYDLEERAIREWDPLTNATDLANPSREWENTSVPRIAMFNRAQDGLPVGELQQALPLLRAEVAQQARTLRNSEAHLFSVLALAGAWEEVKSLGPNTILKSTDSTASAERLAPGEMEPQFTLHDRIMERLRADLSLPIVSILGGDFPSGEALSQANTAYISSCRDYALIVSDLLTGVVRDYAELEGIPSDDAPGVSVLINREAMRDIISRQVREDFKAGIIPLRAAVIAVQPYYPGWTDDDIERWLASGESQVEGEGGLE